MDFGLNETEEMVRANAREFLSANAGPGLARAIADDAPERAGAFWRQISEMGWPGLAISEEHGGAGFDDLALAVLIEQWGGHLAPGPLFETAVLVAPAVADAAPEPTRREVLPALADGSQTATIAILESAAEWRPESIRTSAVKTAEGWVITGTKHFVTYADSADWLLVAARTGDAAKDISIFLLSSGNDATMSHTAIDHASGTPTFTVEFNERRVDESRVIGPLDDGWPLFERLMQRGAAFRAVQLAGAGQQVIDRTVGYVKERRQFGQPVGAFQAIQHSLADMAVSVSAVRRQAYRAVWSLANGSPHARRDVARAKYAASTLIPEVCWKAHQAHGAIGFTWEHDLHLYTRRAIAWRAEFGGARFHREALADELIG